MSTRRATTPVGAPDTPAMRLAQAALASIRIPIVNGRRDGDPLHEFIPDGEHPYGARFLTPTEFESIREILGEHWEPYLPSLGAPAARAALRRWAYKREMVAA